MADKYRTYQIGEIAEITGLSRRALRYYEEQGLLDSREHGPGRFRIYTEEDLERINRIKRLKDFFGFSLKDAKEALEQDDERERLMEYARESGDVKASRKALEAARAIILEEINMVRERHRKVEELERLLEQRLREVDSDLGKMGKRGGHSREDKDG
jgi:DNA-binding transcriptional MerR regulator